MSDLFNTKGNQYDEKGSMIVNAVTIIESGTLSQSALAASGAIQSMYDTDMTTSYAYYNGNDTGHWIKWDLGTKLKLKNLYLYVSGQKITVKLEGSNDNSAWTTLDTKVFDTEAYYNFFLTNPSYRYYRLINSANTAAGFVKIFNIKGIV